MKIEFTNEDIEVMSEFIDTSLKTHGFKSFDKVLGIVMKLRKAKQEELKAQQETSKTTTKKPSDKGVDNES